MKIIRKKINKLELLAILENKPFVIGEEKDSAEIGDVLAVTIGEKDGQEPLTKMDFSGYYYFRIIAISKNVEGLKKGYTIYGIKKVEVV